jgi:hypothetical protein
MHRRDLLATIATTAAGSAVATPARADGHWPWQSSTDSEPEHLNAGKPEHVTLSYPTSSIETYQPRLVTNHLTVQPLRQYAWLAQSPEYEYDVYCYWTFYPRQKGVSTFDEHWGDREPCYVFVKKSTGDVETVVYSAWHWYANRALPVLSDNTHALFRAANRHHQYIQTPTEGRFIELEDFRGTFENWLRNGWDESLAVGVAQDPVRMLTRETWFRRDAGTISGLNAEEALYGTYLDLGIFGAGNSDLN